MGGKKTEDQMETVGGSCDCAFSSSSLDTALSLGLYCVDIHIKWLKLQGSPWGIVVKAIGACPVHLCLDPPPAVVNVKVNDSQLLPIHSTALGQLALPLQKIPGKLYLPYSPKQWLINTGV